MMDDNYESLTNDAKFLLLNLYKMYVERRKDITPKREARLFDSIPYIQQNVMPQWTEDDVLDTVNELVRQNFLSARYGSGTAFFIQLSTEGIAKMERRFKDSTSAIFDTIVKIKSAIPFI
ncbi:hypothetical protein [Pediococcus acidilactici]|uniref:hypothetical protein n=1 Tax=Pediococcus acidilactici TaxID=1254 RepID=UPI0020B7AB69|nr:hypothetical protein [Pediococcus acidilactici]